jgi:hypothetical protein
MTRSRRRPGPATFRKGLELYQASQLIAPRCSSRTRCKWLRRSCRRACSGVAAEANRHKEAAGLLQSASTTPPNAAIARIAGEEWIKAGQPALAITPLEIVVQQPNADVRSKKLLASHVLGGRSADAVTVLTSYLETNPSDTAALA